MAVSMLVSSGLDLWFDSFAELTFVPMFDVRPQGDYGIFGKSTSTLHNSNSNTYGTATLLRTPHRFSGKGLE